MTSNCAKSFFVVIFFLFGGAATSAQQDGWDNFDDYIVRGKIGMLVEEDQLYKTVIFYNAKGVFSHMFVHQKDGNKWLPFRYIQAHDTSSAPLRYSGYMLQAAGAPVHQFSLWRLYDASNRVIKDSMASGKGSFITRWYYNANGNELQVNYVRMAGEQGGSTTTIWLHTNQEGKRVSSRQYTHASFDPSSENIADTSLVKLVQYFYNNSGTLEQVNEISYEQSVENGLPITSSSRHYYTYNLKGAMIKDHYQSIAFDNDQIVTYYQYNQIGNWVVKKSVLAGGKMGNVVKRTYSTPGAAVTKAFNQLKASFDASFIESGGRHLSFKLR